MKNIIKRFKAIKRLKRLNKLKKIKKQLRHHNKNGWDALYLKYKI